MSSGIERYKIFAHQDALNCATINNSENYMLLGFKNNNEIKKKSTHPFTQISDDTFHQIFRRRRSKFWFSHRLGDSFR